MRAANGLRWSVLVASILCLAGMQSAVWGQARGSLMLSSNAVRQFGLEHMWTSQVQVDRGRGKVLYLTSQVSKLRYHTLYEVRHEEEKSTISELQLDTNRLPLGPEGAKRKAENLAESLKRMNPDSKLEPSITRRVVPQITLYATTELGTIHSLDAETGRTRWVTTVGRVDYPTTAAAANDNYVAVINGSSIYVLSARDGTMIWNRRMAGIPMTAPAVSDKYVFAATSKGIIESYSLSDVRDPVWNYKGGGKTYVQPIADSQTLAWTTDLGHIYVASTNPRAMRYRLESHHTVNAAPSILGPRLFTTSVDGFLYCLNLQGEQVEARRVLWKFSLGEPSRVTPVPIDDRVYTISDSNFMFALKVTNGNELWRTNGIKRVLSASKERVYAIGDAGRMVILDRNSGAHLAEIPTEEYDLQLVNLATDRIYLGTQTGVIQCMRETANYWPIIHGDSTEPTKQRAKIIQKGLNDGMDGDKPKPAGGDPFGADPFAAPEPAGGGAKPKAPDDDPFGAPAAKPADPKDADPFAAPPAAKKPDAADPFAP